MNESDNSGPFRQNMERPFNEDVLDLQHISYNDGRKIILDTLDKMDKEDRKVLTRLAYYLYR